MKKHSNNTILLLFNDLLSLGGIQKYNRNLKQALESEFSQFNLRYLSLVSLGDNKCSRWKKLKFIFRSILVSWKEKPVVIICSHINLVLLALLIKKLLGINYVVSTHGIEIWQVKSGIKFTGLKKALLVLAVSSYSKNKMISNGIKSDKIKKLPNTIDAALFYPKAKNQRLVRLLNLKGKNILLTVGRINLSEKYKGHDIILEALQDLGKNHVWLAVGEGDGLPRLKRKAEKLGVQGKVCFVGKAKSNQLVDYYNLCDIFIMPSRGEGFGIVFLEALACGKPVIAGNIDGSREPLLDGKLGFLVDPENKKEIIEAINIIYEGKDKRVDPNYLKEKVKENFSLEVFNKKTKEIFNQILQ